jgi:hypothetical protein
LSNEDKLTADVDAGAAAARALEVTGEAFAELKQQMFDAWLASDTRDEAGREKLWIATTTLSKVEGLLRKRVMNGRVAECEIEAIRKAAERKKLLGVPLPLK